MKLKSAILAVSLLAFGAGAAHAGPWTLGLNAGAGMPNGDFGDAASTGWNAGVSATNMVSGNWGIGADLGYHSWGASDDLKAALAPGESFSFSAIQATGHAMYNFPTQGNAKPYVKFGVGMYNLGAKFESPSGNADDSNSDLGFNFGAGMNFATQGNMSWGLGGAYHVIKDDPSNANVVTFGLNLNFGMSK
jgi:opacity protein-like surface antigen